VVTAPTGALAEPGIASAHPSGHHSCSSAPRRAGWGNQQAVVRPSPRREGHLWRCDQDASHDVALSHQAQQREVDCCPLHQL
jgi:hypothetical protein